MAVSKHANRKMGLTNDQQICFDVHYILGDLDSIANSLERIAKCLENKNQ